MNRGGGWQALAGTFVLLAVVVLLFAPHPLLALASLAVPLVLFRFLWRAGEPPALFFAVGVQWLQATIIVFYHAVTGSQPPNLAMTGSDFLPVAYGAELAPSVVYATWLTLIGVVFVAVGMRVGARRWPANLQAQMVAIAQQLSIRRLFVATLIAIAASVFLRGVAFLIPGLTQPILAAFLVHWIIVFIFAYVVLVQHQGYALLGLVLALELLIGVTGFFGGFKTVLIVVLLAALSAPRGLRGVVSLRTAVLVALLGLSLAVVWTSVKVEYRAFLNQGTGQQVVLASFADRVAKLGELVSRLSPEQLREGVDDTILRVSYIGYFAAATEQVPHVLPHEQGTLWLGAIRHVLIPRLVWPDKPAIHDSYRTREYTGIQVAGPEQGTSISIGYVGETYIDFGPYLMMGVLFLLGVFVGWSYRLLVRSTRYPLLGVASGAVLVALTFHLIETSNAKLLGGFVTGLVVLYLLQRVFSSRFLALVARRAPARSGGRAPI